MYYDQERPINSLQANTNCLKRLWIICLGIFLINALGSVAGAQQKPRNATRVSDQQRQGETEQGSTRDVGRVVITTDLVAKSLNRLRSTCDTNIQSVTDQPISLLMGSGISSK